MISRSRREGVLGEWCNNGRDEYFGPLPPKLTSVSKFFQIYFRKEKHVLLRSPGLSKSSNEIRTGSGQLIVYRPAAREFTLAPFRRSLQAMQCNDIPNIRVEDLLVSCIRRSTDFAGIHNSAQIFDMCEYDIRWLALELVILASPDRCDVGRNAGVDDDVVFSGVLSHGQAAEDFEASAVVDFI